MNKKKSITISRSAKDLAEALNLPASVAIEWELRYQITNQIVHNFKAKKLTITALAKSSETSRARVTNILKGNSEGISLDVLMRILGAMGQRVEIKFLKGA